LIGMFNRFSGPRPRRRATMGLTLGLAILALAVPSAALAGGPSDAQYNQTNQQVSASSGSGGGGPSSSSAPSEQSGGRIVSALPFTGFDVGVIALAAVALLGAGVTLRKLSDPARRSSS
jgi:hypothetical protein